MSLVARKVKDKRVLKLIRAYLNAGVMINGVVVEVEEGCPQGGPLSPLLSNIMLDELDKELEKRGHRFCRLDKFKDKVREILSRSNGRSMEQRIKALNYLIIGWVNYFGLADMKERVKEFDEWIRRRLRMCIWKQWRKIRTRHDKLVQLGVENAKAWEYANTRKGYWRIAGSPILQCTLTNEYLARLGFVSLSNRYSQVRSS